MRTYRQVLHRHGGDHALGRKLHRYCLDAGIPEPQLVLVQPLNIDGEGKTLAWSTLKASTEAIISAGIAVPEELTAALTSLAQFTEDPHTLISGPRIFQLWSRR